jgi:hypothetical protein
MVRRPIGERSDAVLRTAMGRLEPYGRGALWKPGLSFETHRCADAPQDEG